MSSQENRKQLNILEIMGLRRSHQHRSIDSSLATDITIPIVNAYQQYDSPTITRVVKQFAKNIERLAGYVKENSDEMHTTNLANFITTDTSDNNGMNKIFIAPPCTMTSQRSLALKNCADINSVDMPPMIMSFMMEDIDKKNNLIIGITEQYEGHGGQIVRYDLGPKTEMHLSDVNKEVLYEIPVGGNVVFKRAQFANAERTYIYIITNKDIRLFRTVDLINLQRTEGITYSNIVDFNTSYSDDHHRYNDNLFVEDILRQQKIIELITSGSFDSFVDKYYKIGDFPENVLSKTYWSKDPVYVWDVGLVTGKYGLYEIQCYSTKPLNINEFEQDYPGEDPAESRGSLHIRCLDNKPIKDAFFYEDNGEKFLVAINGWPESSDDYSSSLDDRYHGMTVFKIDEFSSASMSYEIKDQDLIAEFNNNPGSFTKMPKNGLIPFDEDKPENGGVNVNAVLDSRGINGAYVNKLDYKQIDAYNIGNYTTKGFVLKYTSKYYDLSDPFQTEKSYYWFIPLGDQKLCNITKVYDKHEFNCLAEYKVNHAMYYPQNNAILLDIREAGLVRGIQEHDADGNTGFRFKIIKEANTYEKLSSIVVLNRCFVAIGSTTLYFVVPNGDFPPKSISLESDINSSVQSIQYSCTYDSSNIICIGDNLQVNDVNTSARLAIVMLKYELDNKEYTKMISQNLSSLISSNFLSKNNAVSKLIDEHIAEMHNNDSIATKLNETLGLLQGQSVKQSTGFSDNLRVSYIILNYPNKGNDFSYVQTDENSTDIYGRLNSQTVNSNPMLTTSTKRNTNAIMYYDTVSDIEGHEILSANKLVYSTCKLSDYITKLTINVPSTGTYYVDNILGWSSGSRTGSSLARKSLDGGYIQGQIENCTTHYQLLLNKVFFNVKNILNVTAQLASAPLKIYSNTSEFDVRHYGMYDSPVIAPLNMNTLTTDYTYDMSQIMNDEIVLSFSVFGGDALLINILIENNED